MWWVLYGYYVMFMSGGQNSPEGDMILQSFFKNLLHRSLFECNGASMLKTYSLIF